jgi:fucokinase
LYPLALDSTLEQYYKEKPEGDYTEELHDCRTKIWDAISKYSMKLIRLSPAKFIHFGTTHELLSLMTEEMDEYEFLDWKARVASAGAETGTFASYNSYIGHRAVVGPGAYIENSYVLDASRVGEGSILSNVKIRNVTVPEHVVLHGIPLLGGGYTVRIFGVQDNPKGTVQTGASYLTSTLPRILQELGLSDADLWDLERHSARDLWNAKLFPVCDTGAEAVDWAMKLYALVSNAHFPETGCCTPEGERLALKEAWLAAKRISLCDSYNAADMEKVLFYQSDLENRIISRRFAEKLNQGVYYKEAFQVFGHRGITDAIYQSLMKDAGEMDFSAKIRIYYAVAQYMKETNAELDGQNYEYPERLCFEEIRNVVYEEAVRKLPDSGSYRIRKDEVHVELPVRVNWGGGWTDTPPYCNEKGGVVINAAISLRGILPIQISVRRLPEYVVEFESQDVGVHGVIRTKEEIQECHDPYDPFSLHKAALIACGIVPLTAGEESLEQILTRLGGGIYLSTQVVGIPKGSGLGTSSILAGACVTGLFDFLGIEKQKEEIYEIVLCMEQIMSTGGGWQDQVGGLTNGIKLITTKPGIEQQIRVEPIRIPERAMQELQERFAVIYTGQRRLARNLLRDVVGSYIGGRPESIRALEEMKPTAALMAFCLKQGNIDAFAELLNRHWELSKQLDAGCTNSCIDQIFLACDDLITARFLAGAGGGGFLMVILKKGVTKSMLHDRLAAIFQDSGVDVWESAFV